MIKRVLGLSAVLAFALATPAYAAWVRPSSAPLLDREGVDSGCVAWVTGGDPSHGPTEGPYAGSPGWVNTRVDLVCAHHWRADQLGYRWQVVSKDGTRGAVFQGGDARSWLPDDATPSPDPFTTAAYTEISPCMLKSDGSLHLPGTSDLPWLLTRGAHQFLLGGYAKVNEYKADLHPYKATVEKQITVTCTRERRGFR